MNLICFAGATALTLFCSAPPARAHLIGDADHDSGAPHYNFSIAPPTRIVLHNLDEDHGVIVLAATNPDQPLSGLGGKATIDSNSPGAIAARLAAVFAPFSPRVKTHADNQFLYVESTGIPAHEMMTGITAWQQQVPLPQSYTGNNAWRLPLFPVPSKTPVSIKGRFLRGAIALAVNGIPIFNPQNNRGEISQEIGELDHWGGHCGRADDYHYHAAPLHLQSIVGKSAPIAYALDGYPLYGLTEPDGSSPANLDAFNGHETPGLGYHYHGSLKYPYVNGGFHGAVVERENQVDPQPRAQSVRPDQAPLRGARITGFIAKENQSYSLKYAIGGAIHYVNYVINDDQSVRFDFIDERGQNQTQTYPPRSRDGRPPGEPKSPDVRKKGPPRDSNGRTGNRPPDDRVDARPPRETELSTRPAIFIPKRTGSLTLLSPAVADGGALPTEFTGDGAGSTLPLEWKGAPADTKSYALIMDHLAPGNVMKCYWTLWNIPASVTSLPKNVQNVGQSGPGFKGQIGYEPPHSQGPGLKTYVLTLYALSAPPQLNQPAREVTREVLLTAIKDLVLDSAELKVTYTRPTGQNQEFFNYPQPSPDAP